MKWTRAFPPDAKQARKHGMLAINVTWRKRPRNFLYCAALKSETTVARTHLPSRTAVNTTVAEFIRCSNSIMN
jgi:hypothetical protein